MSELEPMVVAGEHLEVLRTQLRLGQTAVLLATTIRQVHCQLEAGELVPGERDGYVDGVALAERLAASGSVYDQLAMRLLMAWMEGWLELQRPSASHVLGPSLLDIAPRLWLNRPISPLLAAEPGELRGITTRELVITPGYNRSAAQASR